MSIAMFRGGAVQESALPVRKALSPLDGAAPGFILGESAAIRRVLDQVKNVVERAN
jgi:hypothetical protein